MQHRSIASRLRRNGALVVAVAAAALVFAQVASAAAPVVYTPMTSADLQTDVAAADAAPAGTLSIIQLCGCLYQPTASLTISNNNIEITGPPTYQTNPNNANFQGPEIDGTQTFNVSEPLIVVTSGNLLLKGLDITAGGTFKGQGAIQASGGNIEADDVYIGGSEGTGLVTSGTASFRAVNTDISDGLNDAIETAAGQTGTVNLINSTVVDNYDGGIAGPNIHIYNTILAGNDQADGGFPNCQNLGSTFIAVSSWADDSTCGTTGITVNTSIYNDFQFSAFNGGPATTTAFTSSSNPMIGTGNPAYCQTSDGRFFLYTKGSGGSCDPGSYQHTGTQDTSTSGPVCTIASINESTNPSIASTEVVNATEGSGIGVGPDGVLSATTDNGMVTWPVVGSTFFDATTPSATPPDAPTNSAFPVTATKPVGDLTVNDTHWSFFATDWLGNTTFCN